jgi:hypothetical protein
MKELIGTYKLHNGKHLTVESETIPGMAGEPMEAVCLTVDNQPVQFKVIRGQMNSNDANELGEYLDDVSESNHDSAVKWCI